MARKLFKREGGPYTPGPSTDVLPLAERVVEPLDTYPEASLRGMGRSPMASPGPRQRSGTLPISHAYRSPLLWPALQVQRGSSSTLTKRLQTLYADPRTRVCVSRRQRREVIFATRRNGRNGSGKPYRRTYTSLWRC